MMLPLLLFAATPGEAAVADPERVVRSMFEAFNRHDDQAMERLYGPNARLTSSDFCSPRGKSDVLRTYKGLFSAFPDIHDDIDAIVVQGDVVAVRFVANSRQGRMSMPIHTFLRVEKGVIVSDDSVFDAGGRPCSI